MKSLISALLTIVFCISFCSCGTPDKDIEHAVSEITESFSNDTKATIDDADTNASYTESTSDKIAQETSNVLKYYSELYCVTSVYRDKFIPQKYLLIGNEQIIELFVFNGINQITTIRKTDIERTENTSVIDFNSVKIFDKTNQCISISVEPQQVNEILTKIQETVAAS